MNPIKRIITTLFLLFLLCALPLEAQAADLNSKSGAVTTSGSRLNVRSSPSTGASVVATLNKGSHVTLMEKSGSWWKIEYAKGRYGYCHADYVTITTGTAATVATNGGSLNVRSGPGTSHPKAAVLSKGETVIVLTTANGWSRVLYHGTKTGWVSAQYLSNYYAAVSLWVPNYKQTDSRWANVIVGESGKTMSQIGCATTAIAMLESHRTGTSVYPDAMARSLTYTPSGSVYWPNHYTAVTNPNGYLSAIYARLKAGKPILFGARNAYGSQHWVVITGFTGGTSLTAANFTIHDPGTWSRTNLQQFLEQYPNFYKYFFY